MNLRLKCAGTGSTGNAYALISDGEILLIDAGVAIKEIKKMCDWNVKNIVGCIVSHEHGDHAKSVDDLRYMGIEVVAPYEKEQKLSHFKLGSFDIQSFDVPHNETFCNGFYIKFGMEKVLYMTDLEYCQYNFKRQHINHIIVECNYMKELLNDDLPNFEHKVRGHAELETTKGIIEANDTDSLKNVILCHMGRDTVDNDKMLAEVKKVAQNANVSVAHRGMNLNLDGYDCPF